MIDKPFDYHRTSTDGLVKITKLREKFSDLKKAIGEYCPPSRERSIAITELETSEMWTIRAVVFNDPNSEVAL